MGDGRYTAMVYADWEIWGPCGGYVAALALRAAGAESPLVRPASFFCHYLSVAAFAPVELTVTPLRAGRTVLAQRVAMTQEGRPVLEAMVWSVGAVEGLEHEDVDPPPVPDPGELPTPGGAVARRGQARFAFWDNFDQRLSMVGAWPPPGPLPPTWRTWVRCRPTATFADPWVDAARSLIVLDVGSWPAGSRPHAYLDPPFIAPSLDLYASFQYPRQLVGVAAPRRALAGGAGWPAVVDRPGVVEAAPAHRQRRGPGGVPAHVGGAGDVSRSSTRPCVPGCAT